jgi:hypothetical protein
MNSSCARISIAPFVAFVLSGTIRAQAGFDPLSSRRLGESFFSILDGPFRRTCALELNGDFRADALVLVGDQVVCSFSPGIYHALVALPRSAVDVCAAGSHEMQGREDFLVTSDRPRLERWWLDKDTLEFEFRSLGSPMWAGVTELNAADVTGDDLSDVLGVTADRQAVIFLAHPFTTGGEGFLALGRTIHRLTPIEWDGTAGQEIALLTSEGLGVYELDGTTRYELGTDGNDSDRFCAVHVEGQPFERLSGLFQVSGGAYYLLATDMNMLDAFTWTLLGPILPVAVTSGDYGGEGYGDVCISHKTTGQLLFFENQSASGAPAFTWDDYALWDPTKDGTGAGPAPQNQAHALLEDLDQDGDGDVFFPVEEDHDIAMLRNDTLDHLEHAPTVQSAVYQYDSSSGSGSLLLTLAGPVSPPVEDDKLLVVVWRQPTLKNDVRTESHAIHQALVKLTGWPLTVAIPLTEPLYTETLFHVELRQARCKGTQILSAAASSVWSFTTSASSKEDMTFFHGVPPEAFIETPILDGDADFAPAAGGWTGPMPCIPCFGDGEIPDPGLDHLARWRVQTASAPK